MRRRCHSLLSTSWVGISIGLRSLVLYAFVKVNGWSSYSHRHARRTSSLQRAPFEDGCRSFFAYHRLTKATCFASNDDGGDSSDDELLSSSNTRQPIETYDKGDDDDNEYYSTNRGRRRSSYQPPVEEKRNGSRNRRRRRTSHSYWDDSDDDNYEYGDDYYDDDNYYYDGDRNGGDDFDDSYRQEDDKIIWELCDDGITWVVLPPSYVTKPTCVMHFVGGTFFGSLPNIFYKTLLEELIKATQCCVVVTTIPVTLLENPLKHVSLCRKLKKQFDYAYIDVLCDEYGEEYLLPQKADSDSDNNQDSIPVVGMGHSLGSRLLTVLATLNPPKSSSTDNSLIPQPPPYKSYILMSFNNYGASVSIPLIQTLLKQRIAIENDQDRIDLRTRRKNRQRRERGNKRRQLPRGRRRQDDYGSIDDYDDGGWYGDKDYDGWYNDKEDESLEELVEELTKKVKIALTPESKELEFHPTPDELWSALNDDKRYYVPHTLIVHFNNDDVDQSPRLASALMNITESTRSSDGNDFFNGTSINPSGSVRYAYLNGNHLTPVTGISSLTQSNWKKQLQQFSNSATNAFVQLIQGINDDSNNHRRRRQRRPTNNSRDEMTSNDMRDLRQSIARYITDLVTKV